VFDLEQNPAAGRWSILTWKPHLTLAALPPAEVSKPKTQKVEEFTVIIAQVFIHERGWAQIFCDLIFDIYRRRAAKFPSSSPRIIMGNRRRNRNTEQAAPKIQSSLLLQLKLQSNQHLMHRLLLSRV
jgi:hypothetical protein